MISAIQGVRVSLASFVNDLKKLPPEVRVELGGRLKLLVEQPRAGKLRLHPLNGYHPTIYSIDLQSGKGQRYKATFRLEGSVAVFLRAGTHKQIDRCAD